MAYTTINKSSLNFNTKLYTGNGNANNSITGVGFAPSWVWIKKRSGVDSHYIFDVPRGVDKQLQSNSTAAQYDYSGDSNRTLTAFGSDGFGNFEYAVPSGYFALCTKNLAEYG